jgi:prepilin-type N-terminal cleavage/methylation domain-containing protein
MKNKRGFSVIELLVVLAILVIVITLGFELLSFGRNTFERGEKRYIVQENVRLASELITRELRYANEVVILPEVPLSFNEDRKYIFISDGILKHYKGNGNLTDALGGINSDAEFTTLEFSKSVASDSVLSFVIGAKSGTTPYASVSDVQILNFPEGKSIDDTSLIDLSLESGSVICYSHADNEKRLLEFGFKKVYNPSLSSSYIAYVDEYEYNVNIYIFGEIDLSGLIPHFEYIGKSITLDGIPQYPNDQPVDFNTPQTYTITAQDGSTVDYLITVTKASMPPSASGVKIIIINEAGDNEDEYNAAYEDSLLVGDYHYIPNGCGDEGASGFIWQWSESEDFSSPTTFAYTKEITPMGKAGSYVRFGVKPVSASGISAETFYFSPPEQIKPIVRNAFWKKFIDDIDTENRLEKPEGFVSSVYRRLDYIVESIMSPNTEDLNLTISNGADAYNPLVANGGTHISKDIAGYVADTNSYSITVDAQVRGGSGYGVLINGSVNKNNNNRDSGYMFQFDPGAGGFLVRKIENGDHDPTKAHGLKESVYRPSDIRNNEFRWKGDDYQGNPEWNKRYLTEIVVQIQNDGSLIFKATIIDEQGNRSNEMWFGDFGSYTMDIYDASGRRTTTKTFNGQKMGTDSHWSGGSMLGLRTWNRSEGSFDTLFQEIILGSGFGMDIESAEFLSTEKIMIKFSKPLNTLDMPFYLKDASAGRISFDGRSIDSASINDSNGESLEISLRSPYASAYQVKNGAEKKLSISKGGVKQIYAGEVAIPNGNNYDVNRDTTPPILLSKSVSSDRNLVLNFSEEMDHAQITERSNYSVIKSSKIITPVSITTGNNYKTVTVRFNENENININTDTLILNNLKDVAGNPYEQDTEAPTAPTGLTSTDKGRNYVDLIWNASSDNVSVTGYQVYVNGDHNMTVTDTSCRVSSLSRNTNYRFTVRAVDAAENVSEPSNEISVRTNRN